MNPGKIWMPGGGGGADLDLVTANAGDILYNKVIVGPDGEPLTGTMPNRGGVSISLPINGTYDVPPGYHNGSGKITQSIPTLGAQTVVPTNVAKTVATSGKYMTGNIVVKEVAGLSAGNIKKNAVVGGITGSFEGYVPTATDLYLRGNNPGNVETRGTALATLDSGQITIKDDDSSTHFLKFTRNITGFNYLNIQGYASNIETTDPSSKWVLYKDNGAGNYERISLGPNITTEQYIVSLSISNANITATFSLYGTYVKGAVYRIWLS